MEIHPEKWCYNDGFLWGSFIMEVDLNSIDHDSCNVAVKKCWQGETISKWPLTFSACWFSFTILEISGQGQRIRLVKLTNFRQSFFLWIPRAGSFGNPASWRHTMWFAGWCTPRDPVWRGSACTHDSSTYVCMGWGWAGAKQSSFRQKKTQNCRFPSRILWPILKPYHTQISWSQDF